MVRRARRTRKRKRITIRSPGGRVSLQFRRKRPGAPKCSICGSPVRGTPRSRIWKYPASGRRPSRAYGGTVCHECLREAFRREARGQV